MIDSITFAKYIILQLQKINKDLAGNGQSPILFNETKLHKIMYICDGLMLSAGLNLINEHARAWNYGPVYPKVHTLVHKEKNVFTKIPDIDNKDIEFLNSKGLENLVNQVLYTFGKKNAGQLSAWSHQPGSPWEVALKRNNGIMNGIIDKKEMKLYFSRYENED